jgi:phosphopantetheine adenylyltransferase
MRKLVIIPGGFHPFHAGHMALYNAARETFPSAEIYVAATADTSTRPFPFEIKKKLARLAGIPTHRFIQVKSPFRANEITEHFEPNDTVLIFVRSEKDQAQQPQPGGVKKDGTPGYLQPYKRNRLEPMSRHAYMAYLPVVQFGSGMTSATEIRAKWPDMAPEQRAALVNSMYPATVGNEQLTGVTVKMLDAVMTPGPVNERENNAEAPDSEPVDRERLQRAAKDPEYLKAMLSSRVHYAPYGDDEQAAFFKWVQRSLKHSEEDSQKQQQLILNLQAQIKQLKNQITSIDTQTQTTVAENDIDEAAVVNDPELGMQIRPDGGMGTWGEDSMISNLAQKFTEIVRMLQVRNYSGVDQVLYKSKVVANMLDALVKYQQFKDQQGNRPVAQGREIDLGENNDYIPEA